MQLVRIDSIPSLKGKRVLVREDFNVPLKNGKIESDYKLEKSLKTLKFLCKKGAKIIIVSHLGRPVGFDRNLSLKIIAPHLEKLSGKKIQFEAITASEKGWQKAREQTESLSDGSILFFENIRFFKEEEQNEKKFSKNLSCLGDVFVLDGFGVSHRKASSVCGVQKYLPSYAGFLLQQEIETLDKVLIKPKKPVVVILGGIKLETKIPLIKKFLNQADAILLGGGLANTYLLASGKKIGKSLVDKKYISYMRSILRKKNVYVPTDVLIGSEKKQGATVRKISNLENITVDETIYDIGPQTIMEYTTIIEAAGTIIWNGAVGMFEKEIYSKGTFAIARSISKSSQKAVISVCGGGETEQVLRKLGIVKKITLVSTGGGAMLEYLGGKELPGLMRIKK
jgi:phosphoglycerate kinase